MKKYILVYFNILEVLSVICQPLFAQSPQVGDNLQGGEEVSLEADQNN